MRASAPPQAGEPPPLGRAAEGRRGDGPEAGDQDDIRVRDVSRVYGAGTAAVHALRGVSLAVAPGERLAVVGPSGGGKTTLLNLLGGLDRPTSGEVVVCGRHLERETEDAVRAFRRQHVGVVFQFFHLLPSLTAVENVALPLLAAGRSLREARPAAAEALGLVEMAHRATARPFELSGGQMQRVAIARAIVARPRLLLADEPTGNLDTETGQRTLDLLLSLQQTLHTTIVLVTHAPAIAARCSRTVSIVDGRIVDDGLHATDADRSAGRARPRGGGGGTL
jgi:putative ABC transport system ATP-binding protein